MLYLRYSPFSKPSGPATIMPPTAFDPRYGCVIDLIRRTVSSPKRSATPSKSSRWPSSPPSAAPVVRAHWCGPCRPIRASRRARHQNLHLAFGAQRQRFAQEFAIGDRIGKQQQRRRRALVIELADESLQNLAGRKIGGLAREVGCCPSSVRRERKHLNANFAPS